MVDIQRSRARPKAIGMGVPEGVDPAVHVRLTELQDAIETVAQSIPEVPEQEEYEEYDDSALKRSIQSLEENILTLQREVLNLKKQFPVHQFVQVTAEQDDYVEAVWYNIKLLRAGEAIHVAKPISRRRGTGYYTVGQVIMVVQALTGVVDGAGHLLVWQDNEGGGGGVRIIHVDTYGDLPDPGDVVDDFYVVDDEPNLYFPMGGAWHCLTAWRVGV